MSSRYVSETLCVCVCVYIPVYVCMCARVCGENHHLGDAANVVARLLRRALSFSLSLVAFAPSPRAFSHSSPHRSLRGSNASRQSVFYCVHAQEASIINLDHDLLRPPPSSSFPLSLPPFPSPCSFSFSSALRASLFLLLSLSRRVSLLRSLVRKELPAVKRRLLSLVANVALISANRPRRLRFPRLQLRAPDLAGKRKYPRARVQTRRTRIITQYHRNGKRLCVCVCLR